jgi:4-hydroxy-tetrahydrodipicolinate reductase
MDDQVAIAVVGCSGRMGRTLLEVIEESPAARLAGVTERPGHDWIGQDLGTALGGKPSGIIVRDDPIDVFVGAQAVLDFTSPAATLEHAALAAQARLVHVIGTTGLTREDRERLAAAARHAVIVEAGNMSLGVNLLTVLVAQVARALGPDYDVEILEMHHRAKVDAPSGTALMFGQAAAQGRGLSLEDNSVCARDGHTGARPNGAIGFQSLRGGTVVGDHDVIFAGPAERLVLTHKAEDRGIFANGAVRAALWGRGQQPGEYTMADVLGLNA